jgi:NAD(P)-dependent dehydrogenase (short-subunit alcohol dehydrogenase family)
MTQVNAYRSDSGTRVVVGAASGMGHAVAQRFAADGGRLVVADRDEPALKRVAGALAGPDVEVTAVACDVTDRASIESLVDAVDEFAALVITAGLSPQMADGRDIFAVNLAGSAMVLDAFGRRITAGSVAVCFASNAGYLATLNAGLEVVLDDPLAPDFFERLIAAGGADAIEAGNAYILSKAGVHRLAKRAAIEWAPRGGRVVSVSPGVIDTPMGRLELAGDERVPAIVERGLIKRPGIPAEVVAVVAFLCSGEASYMTACDVLVDGGLTGMLSLQPQAEAPRRLRSPPPVPPPGPAPRGTPG